MPYVVIGGLLTVLELYRLAIHRNPTFAVPPALRVGIPLLLVMGALWRSDRRQRPAAVLTAVCFAFVLNRGLLPGGAFRTGLIFLSTLSLIWIGFRLNATARIPLRALRISVVATIVVFAAGWVLQMLW